jgi:hypothetical protein
MAQKWDCMARKIVHRGRPPFFAIKNLRAATGYEVLPTRSGRCVETPGRLKYASCLALPRTQFEVFLISFSPPGYLIAGLHATTL